MKAVVYDDFGGADVLRLDDVPSPKYAQNDVLVKVRAAGVNPADIALRSGAGARFIDTWFPVVPGWDVAGVVEAVGAGVTEFAPGDEVIGYLHKEILHGGTYAELAAGPAERFVRKPATLSWEEAAALPLASVTAAQAIRALGLTQKASVVVLGASGGVGSLAAQLARVQGHRVIGVGSVRGLQFLRSLGFETVVKGTEAAAAILSECSGNVDAVVDCAGHGGINLLRAAFSTDTRIVSIADGGDGIRTVFARPLREDLAYVVDQAGRGSVRANVFAQFPLSQASMAQDLVASGEAAGRVVLRVS